MQLTLSELAFAIYNAIKDPEDFEKIHLKAKIGGEKFKLWLCFADTLTIFFGMSLILYM